MREQLAEQMGGRGRVAHHEPPGAAELGVDVRVRRYPVVGQGLDQGVDPALGVARVERSLAVASAVLLNVCLRKQTFEIS